MFGTRLLAHVISRLRTSVGASLESSLPKHRHRGQRPGCRWAAALAQDLPKRPVKNAAIRQTEIGVIEELEELKTDP